MKKYLSTIAILLVALSMLLAACQPAVAPTAAPAAPAATEAPAVVPATEAPAAPAATEAPAAKAPVTLRFLKISDELEAKALAEMVDAFHKIDGGKWAYVNVEYDAKPFAELFPSIEKSVATGGAADLIQADGPDVKHFAVNKVLLDLTPYFTADEMKTWDPASIEEGMLGDKFYGTPEAQSCQLMWYNVDMMKAAGIDVTSTEGWTLGDKGTALANWTKLTKDANGDGTPEVFGTQFPGPWDYFQRVPSRTNGVPGDNTFEGVAPDGITFTGYFDTPEAIEAYKFQQEMVTKYKVQSGEQTQNSMLSGLAATVIYQDLVMGTQKDQFPAFNMAAIEPPYFKTKMCQTGSWHWAIGANTTHKEEAVAFLKYLSSDAGATFIWKYKSQLPANVNLLNTLPDYKDVPARKLMKDFMLQYGRPRIMSPGYTEYNSLFSEFYKTLISGEDAEKLAHEYAGLMDEATAKYKGWNK
jgi:fructooligosaccharide transport system substrate-binding protein